MDELWGARCQLGEGRPALGNPGDPKARPRRDHGWLGHPSLQLCPYAWGVRCPRRILGAGAVAFVPVTNACVVVGGYFCSLGTPTAEPAAHPGTAPARGTRPQEKAAAGDWEEGREAGDLLGEALRPARIPPCPPGLVETPSPSAGGMRCSGPVAAGFLFGNLG